jgi:hypothetical protein
MANYCSNQLKILGDEEELQEFMKAFASKNKRKDNIFSFESIVPIPQNIYRGNIGKEEIEKYGRENCWYDWCLRNWGTKWNPYPDTCNIDYDEQEEGIVELSFDTAWSPCTTFIKNASKKFKDLTFLLKYEEVGMRFTGIAKAKKGKLINKCIEY